MLSFAFPVFAQEKVDMYTVVLPVENQSKPQQQIAFEVALHQLVDTHPSFKQASDLSTLFDHPELYVESFSYQSDPEQEDALKIIVHFDRGALSPFLLQSHAVQSQRLDLQISGVTSELILNSMTHYLSSINAIKSVMIAQVMDENVTLSVTLQGNIGNFIQTLLSSQHFVALNTDDPLDQSALRFKWIGDLNV